MEYIKLAAIQKELETYYTYYHQCATIPKIIKILYKNGEKVFHENSHVLPQKAWTLDDHAFMEHFSQLGFPVHELKEAMTHDNWRSLDNSSIEKTFIQIYKHLNFTDQENHAHRYFEITYVMKGQCSMTFEKKNVDLKEGDTYIIAPGSRHGMVLLDKEAFVLNIIISKKAFESILQQIMISGDLMSKYLQTILYHEDMPNYLLIHTSNTSELKFFIKSTACEIHNENYYSSARALSWISLFLGTIVGEFHHSVHMYQYEDSPIQENHLLLIQYLQSNYLTVTLENVAKLFNYNKTYLSRLILKLTGRSFMEIITEQKLAKACDYLRETHIKISEIAQLCHFDNQNYFGKVFKKYFLISPSDYRKQFQAPSASDNLPL